MAIEKREIEVAKEFDDVMVLAVKVVETVKNKGDYSALIPALIEAVDKATAIPEELKANKKAFANTAALRALEIADLFV